MAGRTRDPARVNRSFAAEQRGVAVRMALAAVTTAIALGAGIAIAPDLGIATLPDRIAFALRCDVFVFVWVVAMIARIAALRFFSPAEIDSSGTSTPSPQVTNARAVLQNTLEQVVIAAPAHLALATLLPARMLVVVPIGVVLFGIGRALFWAGFARGAAARAFGFALTFYPTVAASLAAVLLIVSQA
ncbi:MAPEG family protein [Polymorphobacter sp. PAMC 29334]|nr:MAPEG family protein [Polymorphobacter sp. PAMC 29334]